MSAIKSAIKLLGGGEKAPQSVQYLKRAKNLYELLASQYMNGVGARVMPVNWRYVRKRKTNYYVVTQVKLKVREGRKYNLEVG